MARKTIGCKEGKRTYNHTLAAGAAVILLIIIGAVSYANFGTSWPTFAAGKTYYVDAANGNDSNNDGMSLGAPFKTVKKALSVAIRGATVNIRGGAYRESNLYPKAGVTIQGYGTESTTLWDSSRSVFVVENVDTVTFRNFTIADTSAKGILVKNSGNIHIVGMTFQNVKEGAIHCENSWGMAILYNTITNSPPLVSNHGAIMLVWPRGGWRSIWDNIYDNTITGRSVGIAYMSDSEHSGGEGGEVTLSISNNKITVGRMGIQITGTPLNIKTVYVRKNIITYDPNTYTGYFDFDSAGVLLETGAGMTATIENNTITGDFYYGLKPWNDLSNLYKYLLVRGNTIGIAQTAPRPNYAIRCVRIGLGDTITKIHANKLYGDNGIVLSYEDVEKLSDPRKNLSILTNVIEVSSGQQAIQDDWGQGDKWDPPKNRIIYR
ncbi:hypothetical protein A2V68_01550 [candidate division Kazan bacterium RBG_13_50_9]|uniref:Right handed beta helix domain-containing protein n=1 Tax=candidate division Kazan bacterium RBG_13_50_9 TaxID=1798535 RepID=A0A1F4NT15_UNCK3|nr:MAG: hypothetical protein A2V68_01550 [candidate division Kazan bacterium RBG_13_50_9]